MLEKFKSWLGNDQNYYMLITFLVGVVAFGLGRWSVVEISSDQVAGLSGVTIITNEEIRDVKSEVSLLSNESAVTSLPVTANKAVAEKTQSGVTVIASRNGTKYHLPNCPGASQIKPENQITFASISLAEAAGYKPASNCPGL